MSAGGRLDIEIQVLRILQNSSEFKFCESWRQFCFRHFRTETVDPKALDNNRQL
jgi:hypothetical protein